MAKYELLPFAIGSTALGGNATIGATDKQEFVGKEYLIEDLNYSSQPYAPRAYYGSAGEMMLKRVRVVRNTSGIAILPRQLCIFKGGFYGQQVNGLAYASAMEGYPADEFLPAAGVANNDLFYVVVDGPAECLTDLAGGATNNWTATTGGVNSWATALTAVTSQSTTAGRVYPQDLTGATANLANQIQHRIGLVLSALTTSQTNAAILLYVKKWSFIVTAGLAGVLSFIA
jgi:hypothetical protein